MPVPLLALLLPALIGAGSGIAQAALSGGDEEEETGGSGPDHVGSFAGTGVDPVGLLGEGMGGIRNFGNALGALAGSPVQIPGAFAQQPGSYTGGGLPFDIGLSGMDPALMDPSYLEIPGLPMGGPLFGGLQGMSQPQGGGGEPGRMGSRKADKSDPFFIKDSQRTGGTAVRRPTSDTSHQPSEETQREARRRAVAPPQDPQALPGSQEEAMMALELLGATSQVDQNRGAVRR